MNVPFVLVCLAIIALLSYWAYRRVQAINARIAEAGRGAREQSARPFSALMELYRLQEEHKRGKRE